MDRWLPITRRIIPTLIAAGVLAWILAYQIDFREVAKTVAGVRPGALAAGIALLGLGLAIQIFRLRLLLRGAGLTVPIGRAARAQLVGMFYSNAIPFGQIGGDPIRAVVVSRGIKDGLPRAFAAVVMDRVIGLLTLCLLAGVAVLPLLGDERYRIPALLVAALLTASLTATGVMLFPALRRRTGLSLLLRLFPFRERAAAFGEALRELGGKPLVLLRATGLSLLCHGAMVLAAWAIGGGLNIEGVDLVGYGVLVPLANVIATTPGLPGGWGIGEGAYIVLFGYQGVAEAAAFSLSALTRLSFLGWSLLGAPFALGLTRART